ncbi:MAG: hypothetical protein M3O50_20645 [Myxococcota bacterium]|nr:hypothetical protein [Myxococcota bacterium]
MKLASRARWLAFSIAALPATALADRETGGAARPLSLSAVEVETIHCPRLRSERIEQLLRLELTTLVPVVSELPTLRVAFSCTDGSVRITLTDPVTIKDVTRDASLGASPDPERALALAASELFLASWAELLIPSVADDPRVPAAAAVVAKQAVERVVPPRPTPPSLAIDVQAIGRDRHLSAPILTVGGALRVGRARCPGPGVFADAGWEKGSASRALGRVDVTAAVLGLGARWCLQIADGQLGISAAVAAAYVSLQGVPSLPSFYGAHYDGLTAEARGGIDANVTLRSVRVGGAILAGALAPGPAGHVDGGTTVRFDGPWIGAALFAGLVL